MYVYSGSSATRVCFVGSRRIISGSRPVSGEEAALSYRNLRALIGYIGLTLPVTLVVAGLVNGHVQSSLSSYYYTAVGSIFTGALAAIGVFLLAYRIRAWAWDGVLTTLAGIAAIGTALFHARPRHPSHEQVVLATIHLSCAATLFILLGAISLLIFPYADTPRDAPWRIACYRALGALIWLALILMPVLSAFAQPFYNDNRIFLILETVCVLAFSVSFIIKGHTRPRAREEEGSAPAVSAAGSS